MNTAHELILLGGALGLLSILVGVALTAGIVGATAVWLFPTSWIGALLIEAVLAQRMRRPLTHYCAPPKYPCRS